MKEIEASFGFVDLVGYTAASWTHGDRTAAELSIKLVEIAKQSSADGDEVVKSIGDAVLLRSPTPRQLLGLIGGIWETADSVPLFPRLRAGAHHGLAIEHQGDYYGTTVNIASRVTAEATTDEILATTTMAKTASEAAWGVEALGPVALRNVGEPVEIVRLRHTSYGLIHVDPICFMRVDPVEAVSIVDDHGTHYFCSDRCADRYLAKIRGAN